MTYTKDNLRQIFQQPFNAHEWQQMLQHYFQATELKAEPERIDGTTEEEQGYYLGAIDTTDSYRIGLFYYQIQHGNVARKRVGLRNLVKSFVNPNWGEFDAALVVFDSGELWRLSFVSDIKGESTAPKRYTYVFGEGDSFYNTPVGRFDALQRKGISFENIKEAFSVEALSKEFFDEYREHYADIVEYITGKRYVKEKGKWVEKTIHEPCHEIFDQFVAVYKDPEKTVRDYIKKLMGRLVFLQFLQKKEWMGVPADRQDWKGGDTRFLQNKFNEFADKDNFIDGFLEPLFNDLNTNRQNNNDLASPQVGSDIKIPFLNGGLFQLDEEDCSNIRLPQHLLGDVLDFFERYNFTIDENDPNDAQIGVDPEMLGRVFENLLEDNKDKGAFYTPKEIVQYMCQESLIAYLQTGIDDESHKESIRQFVLTHEAEHLGSMAEDISIKLLNVKICDPAIGSGAFPMGLLRQLYLCQCAIHPELEDKNSADIKRHIIQNNIYGVDIEKGAVDIARLRFWLSLIVDEETPRFLPNLDFKIMQGNSLLEQYKGADLSKMTTLSTEHGEGTQLTWFDKELDILRFDLREKLDEYYNCPDHQRKEQLKQEIIENVKRQLCEQNIDVDFGNLDLSANDQFTLWHTWFYDVFSQGGFDIVIANPPYIGVKGHKELFDKVKEGHLSPFFIGKMDYFYFFFHHAINILKVKGVATFITTNYYITADGAIKLRKHLYTNCCLAVLIDLGEMKLFENAPGQHNMITLFSKVLSPEDKCNCSIIVVHRNGTLNEHLFSDIINKKDTKTSYAIKGQEELYDGDGLYIRLNSFSNNALENILRKMANGNETIRNICDINQGIVSGADYVSEKHKKSYSINAEKGDGIFVLSNQNAHDSLIIGSIEKSESESTLLKVFFKNSDIDKYVTQVKSDKTILFIGKDIKTEIELAKRYPIIYNHLKLFRNIMIEKRQSLNEKTDQWFTLNRGTSHQEVFQREKIVCPQRSKTNTFGYNNIDWYAASDVFYLTNPKTGYKLKYILALLNSKLYYVWLYHRGKRKGESLELTATPLSEIPIAMANEDIQNKVIEIIDNIQQVLKKNPHTDISFDSGKIDILVYHLYGLTYDEVLIVDPETPITREEYEKISISKKNYWI